MSPLERRLLVFQPITSHITPQREAPPLSESRVVSLDLLIGSFACAVVHPGELASNPRIERETVVSADQLQHVLRSIIAYTLDALHVPLQLRGRQLAPEPAPG